jgi:hypothetical protein
MRNRPALLKTSAAIAWTAALYTGFDGNHGATGEHGFILATATAVVLSLAAILEANISAREADISRRIDRAFIAMHQARVSQPDDRDPPSGPFPAISMDRYRSERRANRG